MTRIARIISDIGVIRCFANGQHELHEIIFLSPDEPDEPDGWNNELSG